jgi:carbamoylphosphate synthase small subunit
MFKQIAAMIKNEHIADLLAVQGIDTRDIYEQLRDAETEADLNKINQTLLKALC